MIRFVFVVILGILISVSSESSTISYKGYLRIVNDHYFKGSEIFGEIVVSKDTLYFYPANGEKYIKNIVIPFVEINSIKELNHRSIKIERSDGCLFTLVLNKKNALLDVISVNGASFFNPQEMPRAKIPLSEDEDFLLFHGWGAFLYKRVKVKGKLELGINVRFSPSNSCVYKSINIDAHSIRSIKKIGDNKYKVKLNDGKNLFFIDN